LRGISADGTRITTTFPANAIGNERPLEIEREREREREREKEKERERKRKRKRKRKREVTRLDRGEPASSLFEVPSDYKARKEIAIRKRRAFGEPPKN
jgi:hypothetical protein